MIPLDTYLQIITIMMGVIAVALPLVIAALGFVYTRQIKETIDNLSGDVNALWVEVDNLSNEPPRNNQ